MKDDKVLTTENYSREHHINVSNFSENNKLLGVAQFGMFCIICGSLVVNTVRQSCKPETYTIM